MKCQTENVANSGYWFHWLDNAFGILAGRLPISVVDVDKIGKSPTLPMILRDPDHFLPLPTIVRDRHQVEFKRRFGLSGDASGFDVDCDWKPTMTPAYGLHYSPGDSNLRGLSYVCIHSTREHNFAPGKFNRHGHLCIAQYTFLQFDFFEVVVL